MAMWVWFVGFAWLVVLAAVWAERHRGSSGEYRSLDLPATKRGRPRPVDFDHTVGPAGYDVDPVRVRPGPIGTSASTAYRGRP